MIAIAAGSLGLTHLWMGELAGISPAITSSLIAAVWQGTLLAVVAWLTLQLLPKTPASVRFAIWFGVFLVATALPAISLLPHATVVANPGQQHAWMTLDGRWSIAIAALWACASLVRAMTLVAAGFRVRALWKRATPVETGAAQAIGGSRPAQICVSEEVDRPTVIGFFSPKILIPGWLLEKLTAAELEQIVLHEAGHLGRADDWMNLLQKVALVIFPLNPALAWVEQRLCFERELAVDERVLHAFAGKPGAAKAYAECLTTLAEYRLGRRKLALALGALGRESELGRRVGRILRRGERMRPWHARLVLGGAMLGLLVAAAGFEHCPQVVGFAPAKAETVAQTGMDQLTDRRIAAPIARHAVAVTVLYKQRPDNHMQSVPYVEHEIATVAVDRGAELQAGDAAVLRQADTRAGAPHMVQIRASVPGSRSQSRSVSDVEPSQPAVGLTQWVVVTEWQDGMGSRLVLTTASVPEAAGPNVPAPAAATQVAPENQVYPYAAVPVRGGWLVFQL